MRLDDEILESTAGRDQRADLTQKAWDWFNKSNPNVKSAVVSDLVASAIPMPQKWAPSGSAWKAIARFLKDEAGEARIPGKFKGLYVEPTLDGARVANSAIQQVGGPNKRLSEWHALSDKMWRDYPQKIAPDIEAVVRGIDRGNVTELVSPYTILNRNWAWGKKKP